MTAHEKAPAALGGTARAETERHQNNRRGTRVNDLPQWARDIISSPPPAGTPTRYEVGAKWGLEGVTGGKRESCPKGQRRRRRRIGRYKEGGRHRDYVRFERFAVLLRRRR